LAGLNDDGGGYALTSIARIYSALLLRVSFFFLMRWFPATMCIDDLRGALCVATEAVDRIVVQEVGYSHGRRINLYFLRGSDGREEKPQILTHPVLRLANPATGASLDNILCWLPFLFEA
jgi:hypothetical protein